MVFPFAHTIRDRRNYEIDHLHHYEVFSRSTETVQRGHFSLPTGGIRVFRGSAPNNAYLGSQPQHRELRRELESAWVLEDTQTIARLSDENTGPAAGNKILLQQKPPTRMHPGQLPLWDGRRGVGGKVPQQRRVFLSVCPF